MSQKHGSQGGEIDFVASAPLTATPATTETLFGRPFLVETSTEIIAKKVWHRGAEFTARDVFDFAVVAEIEREALKEIAPILRDQPRITSLALQQSRKPHLLRLRPDGVTYVDVHVQANGSSRQRAAERDPKAAVIVLFADDLRGRVIGIENQTVVHGDSGNLSHDCQRSCGAVLEHTGRQINVAGRSPSLQRSQQHSALQDKIFGVFGSCKSIEETLQGVKLNEFVSWPPRSLCTTLQVEIAPAGQGIPWSHASQRDFQRPANGALGTMQRLGHLEQRSRFGASASEPTSQRFPGDITSLSVPEPNDIDEGTFGGVQADREALSKSDLLTPQREAILGEDMNIDRRLEGGSSGAARNRDVDAIWNAVRQAMACQSREETERALGDAASDFEKVLIYRWGIRPSIEAPAYLLNQPPIPIGVQAFGGETSRSCTAVGKDAGQVLPDRIHRFSAHR